MNAVPLLSMLTRLFGADVQPDQRAETFRGIYEAEFHRLYAYIRYRVGDATIAEDLTADVFVRFWIHMGRIRNPAAVTAWLFTTARHLTIDYLRRSQRVCSLEALAPTLLPTINLPEADIVPADQYSRILQGLGQLGEREREIIGWRFAAGLRNREIAGVLGISEGNVAKILHRAITKLRLVVHPETHDDSNDKR
ncbi:sigma-70 family RNA polymerase sigma factor [Candidatus Gracilibacteria bacterium]|nr:sigma-70 family RNA polymerase sigma factor [Candidatus Gracilibacteria bacterium]